MQTKQDLLTKMAALRACYEATTWVTWVTSQEGTALEIGLRSDRVDWLVWLIGQIDPVAIAGFARRCADRAKTYVAYAYAADRAANAANADADRAANAAYAFSAADRAARAANADADRAAYADAERAAYAFSAADRAAAACAAAAYAFSAADADRADRTAYAADADERQAQLTDLRAMWGGVCT